LSSVVVFALIKEYLFQLAKVGNEEQYQKQNEEINKKINEALEKGHKVEKED